jgi:hypothetical protein
LLELYYCFYQIRSNKQTIVVTYDKVSCFIFVWKRTHSICLAYLAFVYWLQKVSYCVWQVDELQHAPNEDNSSWCSSLLFYCLEITIERECKLFGWSRHWLEMSIWKECISFACIHGFGAMMSMVAGYFSWCSFFQLSSQCFREMVSKLAVSITNVGNPWLKWTLLNIWWMVLIFLDISAVWSFPYSHVQENLQLNLLKRFLASHVSFVAYGFLWLCALRLCWMIGVLA